jgi:AraC-like DNA-binding protein
MRSTRPRLLDEVRAAIGDELRCGDVDIERVARCAVELLQRGLPLGDIAEHLGFSEARAFRRAFRRATGLVPSAIPRPA